MKKRFTKTLAGLMAILTMVNAGAITVNAETYSMVDLLKVAKTLAKMMEVSEDEKVRLDMDSDGTISTRDLIQIAQSITRNAQSETVEETTTTEEIITTEETTTTEETITTVVLPVDDKGNPIDETVYNNLINSNFVDEMDYYKIVYSTEPILYATFIPTDEMKSKYSIEYSKQSWQYIPMDDLYVLFDEFIPELMEFNYIFLEDADALMHKLTEMPDSGWCAASSPSRIDAINTKTFDWSGWYLVETDSEGNPCPKLIQFTN